MQKIFSEISLTKALSFLFSLCLALQLSGPLQINDADASAFTGRSELKVQRSTMTLAQAGTPQIVIVAPKDAPAPVRFAAIELKEHLDKMIGGSFQIVDKVPPDGKAIVLGDHPTARKAGLDVTKIACDGYRILMSGNTIYIAGRDDHTQRSDLLYMLKPPFKTPGNQDVNVLLRVESWDFERGTLYGVYRFLEELGVRWFFAGPVGTVIPSKKDLKIQRFSLFEEPAFVVRHVGQARLSPKELNSPAVRRGMDPQEIPDLQWDGPSHRLWLLRIRTSSPWYAFGHQPPNHRWEQRFGKDHPEYFALRPNGKRDLQPESGRTGYLCYTNPDVFRTVVAEVEAFFGGKDAATIGLVAWSSGVAFGKTFSLLPHDSGTVCETPECLRLIHKERPFAGWQSELIWQFVDRVSRAVKQTYPDKYITCLAYANYSQPPETLERLSDNVIVGLCPEGYNKTWNLVSETGYSEYMRIMQAWRRKTSRPFMYWLHDLYRYFNGNQPGVPMFIPTFLGKLVKDMAKEGNLTYIEQDLDSPEMEHLKRYLWFKLLYNPNLDPEALMKDYATKLYGPGGDLALSLFKDLESRCTTMAKTRAGVVDVWEKYFSDEVMQDFRRRADDLVRITQDTPHAAPAQHFSKYFIGKMEKGRVSYVKNVKALVESKGANLTIHYAGEPVVVDGVLDEAAWTRATPCSFVNNRDGKPTKWKSTVQVLYSREYLYFAFVGDNPNLSKLPVEEFAQNYVEIFLDPGHTHQSYYWLIIDLEGRIQSKYFPGGNAPPDDKWNSHVKVTVKKQDDRWVLEIALPRNSLRDGTVYVPAGVPWGANFCRTLGKPLQPEDAFSGFSPLLRGAFHQPDLFGHLLFGD